MLHDIEVKICINSIAQAILSCLHIKIDDGAHNSMKPEQVLSLAFNLIVASLQDMLELMSHPRIKDEIVSAFIVNSELNNLCSIDKVLEQLRAELGITTH